jgi:hypothetical protein
MRCILWTSTLKSSSLSAALLTAADAGMEKNGFICVYLSIPAAMTIVNPEQIHFRSMPVYPWAPRCPSHKMLCSLLQLSAVDQHAGLGKDHHRPIHQRADAFYSRGTFIFNVSEEVQDTTFKQGNSLSK